jgi:hypothetical protein
LDDAGDQFNSQIGKIPFDQAKSQVFLAGVIVLAVISGVIALQSVLLCRNRFACCMFKGFAWVSVLLTTLVFLLAGVFILIGIPGSDVCYAPGTTLNSLVGSFDSSGTLTYYLTCGTNPALATPTAVNFLKTSQGALGDSQAGILTFTSALSSGSLSSINFGSAFNASSNSLKTRIPAANNSISLLISDVVSCPSVSGIFDSFYGGLCGGFITSAITLATVLTAAAALLTLQMSLGVEVCCRHPGDADRWEDSAPAAAMADGPKLHVRGAPMQGVSINSV